MKITCLLAIIILSVAIFSCNTEEVIDLKDSDYLIFGHFYGFCVGEECIEIFKLTESQLFEDSNDNYDLSIPFNFYKLSNSKFEQANDLINYLPAQLLLEEKTVIGCPDCADGGGIYIEIHDDGETKSWRIDQRKTELPSYLHTFVDKVNEKIALINN